MLELECPPELRGAARAALETSGIDAATDVLSFPVDGAAPTFGPRELGDVVICPEHTVDLEEATVHGVLHLLGMDHETDGGEMLALQDRVLAELRMPGERRRHEARDSRRGAAPEYP